MKAFNEELRSGRPDIISYLIASTVMWLFIFHLFNTWQSQSAEASIAYSAPAEYDREELRNFEIVWIEADLKPPPTPKKKPKIQFKDIAAFVVKDLEGDDKIAREPNGGIAKFGINSNAHPGVDVESLTRQEAYKILKRKYWDKIDGDNLPVNIRLVAFDAAVNHGTGFAKKIIQKAKNCENKLIKLRKAEYIRIVTANPTKYGRYKEGWFNRLDRLKSKVDS